MEEFLMPLAVESCMEIFSLSSLINIDFFHLYYEYTTEYS